MLGRELRIPEFEVPVAEQELLEIAMVLCFALAGTVKDEEEEDEDLLPHEQHNLREQCLLCVVVRGQYCWHGHARDEEVPCQILDTPDNDEELLLIVNCEN